MKLKREREKKNMITKTIYIIYKTQLAKIYLIHFPKGMSKLKKYILVKEEKFHICDTIIVHDKFKLQTQNFTIKTTQSFEYNITPISQKF